MHHRHVELFLHGIWSTWDRVPWIASHLDYAIRRCAHHHIAEAGGTLIACGAADDHVHVLLRAPPTIVASRVIGAIKGGTSHAVHAELGIGPELRFSEGYALFSVSPEVVSRVARYVDAQRQRHADGRLDPRWETSLENGG